MVYRIHGRVHWARPTLALSLLVVGCSSPKRDPDRYPISLTVDAGVNRPVSGARVHVGASALGVSDGEGRIGATLSGVEGQVLEVTVDCPEGHRSPEKPILVTLRAVAESDRTPEYHARCEPLLRSLVVAVRAEHGANLPVLYLGREVARTDKNGAAHVLLRRPPEDSVEILLDTHERPELRPRNPTARFQVGSEDEVVAFEPALQAPKPPKKRAPPPATGITDLSVRR